MRFFKHLKTVLRHRHFVMFGCFRIGLYRQGLLHDLSKLSRAEFWVGVKYFQGSQSPNNAERMENGYSGAWLHHKGRNKHHYEYWIDFSLRYPGGMAAIAMPFEYIAEMFVDRVAACKVYGAENYDDGAALRYYQSGRDPAPMHDDTRATLVLLLEMLANDGEKKTYEYIKKRLRERD
ncbi:MAG: DUF5662 family protein [Lachnospiraceae bacterium]|jgi:hypothetical protein|nr:DUF5662 family protein [Lachnospiraceae bacterium]